LNPAPLCGAQATPSTWALRHLYYRVMHYFWMVHWESTGTKWSWSSEQEGFASQTEVSCCWACRKWSSCLWTLAKLINSLLLVVLELLNLFVLSPSHHPVSCFCLGDGLALFLVHNIFWEKSLVCERWRDFPSWTCLYAEGLSGSVFPVPWLWLVCIRISCCWRELFLTCSPSHAYLSTVCCCWALSQNPCVSAAPFWTLVMRSSVVD
jgi:hypothetical protein